MKYLNDTGLTKLWEKIKSKFALQTDLEVIDERTITLNSSVSNLNDEVVFYSESIGSLEDLSTSEQGTIVGAINELYNSIDSQSEDIQNLGIVMNRADDSLSSSIGTLSNLTTTDQTDLVSAINEVNNNVNGSYISCIGKSGGLTTTTTAAAIGSWEKVPLVVDSSQGSDFTLVNNQIVVGAGVKAVEVSAQAYFITNVTSGDVIRCGVCLNNSDTAVRALTRAGGTYVTHGTPPRIVAVSEGDVLDLRACNGARTGTVISSGADTFLSIRKVA